ncbi:MAG: EAL domain-containing protein [Rhodoferax sp.]|nr:EAL domain-containing protein [Rhodoferax sp.]
MHAAFHFIDKYHMVTFLVLATIEAFKTSGCTAKQRTLALLKALGLKTISEGVEDEATATLLTSLGADYLQGYYFAKPMPRADFEQWLKNHPVAHDV